MSDMNLTQAADEVRKILRGFKAVEQVSAALESVGSIQNAGKEAETQLGCIKAEIQKAQEELTAAKVEIQNAKDEAKKVSADAKAKAENKMDKLAKEAAEFAAKANEDACAMTAKVEAAKLDLDKVLTDRDAAQRELDDLEAKIAKVKAQAAKLLGG
jgi:chromosome segregation ATPase